MGNVHLVHMHFLVAADALRQSINRARHTTEVNLHARLRETQSNVLVHMGFSIRFSFSADIEFHN